MAIKRVVKTKTLPKNGFIPVINMWCPHTINERKPIAKIEPIIALYPNIGFLEFVEIISDDNPSAGNKTMYTSGWPRNQKRC